MDQDEEQIYAQECVLHLRKMCIRDSVNEELAKKWLANGAKPTDTVGRIFKEAGIEK